MRLLSLMPLRQFKLKPRTGKTTTADQPPTNGCQLPTITPSITTDCQTELTGQLWDNHKHSLRQM